MIQKRERARLYIALLKNVLSDGIIHTSQLVNEYFLQRQRHGIHEQRVQLFEPREIVLFPAAQYERLQLAGRGAVENVQSLLRQRRAVRQGEQHLGRRLLQFGNALFQQAAAALHDADVVAHVLQLAEVVAGHQYRGAPLGHVTQQQRPHLANYASN